uniref:Putative LOV domain-containing protein n=2 Tax=Saccharina japonica TaxID=88149 RepID=A0A126X1N8_SACJA|nr:putative LOV domain-containing protein [Saccharina japonica]
MDTAYFSPAHPFAGEIESVFGPGPAAEDPGLWLASNDGDEGLMGSFESGGALMNSGGWSISTAPGEAGLRWNAVKTEVFDELAGLAGGGGANKLNPLQPSVLPGTTKSKAGPAGFPGMVKTEPEEGWAELMSPPMACAWPPSATDGFAAASAATTPNSPPSSFYREAVQPLAPALEAEKKNKKTTPAVASATTRTARTAAPTPAAAPQRSSPRAAGVTSTPAPPLPTPTVKVNEDEEEEGDEEDDEDGRDGEELDTGSELTDKRRRNREHAKRSRLRKRVRLGGLEEMVLGLRRENVRLRRIVKKGIPERADSILRLCASDNTNPDTVAKQDVVQGMRPGMSVGSSSSNWSSRLGGGGGGGSRSRPKLEGGTRRHGGGSKDRRVPSALKLMSPCYQSVKALAESQANFVLTNPNLPDCPIIFASQGFLELTGYEGRQVIGKNCRFLQGPGTDPGTVSIIRNNLAGGRDTSVCILNYKADGTPFWNQLSIGVLLDAHGQVANHVGVLCEVNQMPPAVFHRLLHRVPLPESLLNDESSDSEDSSDTMVNVGTTASSSGGGSGGARSANASSSSSSTTVSSPRVVDRLRRTRAAAAIRN